MNLPSVFAFTPTYGRPNCVANIIYQWKNMTYEGKKELLILDDGGQYPSEPSGKDWQIVSIKKRFSSLGEKQNACVSFSNSSHDLIVVMEDDDVYAPWTLQAHAEAFEKHPISIPTWFCFEERTGELTLKHNKRQNGAHAGWAYSRNVFRCVQGYPWIDIPSDHDLWLKLTAKFSIGDPTMNFPPYLISRLLSREHDHLSRLKTEDPWKDAEMELSEVPELPKPQSKGYEKRIRELIFSNYVNYAS